MKRSCRPAAAFPAVLSLLAWLAPGLDAQYESARGFAHVAVPAVPPGFFIGGMDRLPNGNLALFDSAAVVEVEPATGAVVQTLFTPPGFVFGSFVAVDPSGTFLLFGESSNHKVWHVPLDGSPAAEIATIPYNFDCAFAAPGLAYISFSNLSFTFTGIVLLDVATGGLDLIAEVPGPSGPLAVDGAGALFYAENSAIFPAPPGSASIYSWSAAAVAAVTGPGHLLKSDAVTFRAGLDNVFDMAFDASFDLIVSDSINGTLTELSPSGLADHVLGGEQPFNAVTFLAWLESAPPGGGAFGPYQPASGGALAAISTDWVAYNDLNVVRPERLPLATNPASPVPVGPFTLEAAGGPPFGTAWICAAHGPFAPEYTAWYQGVPLLFGLEPQTFQLVGPAGLDGAGALAVAAANPGLADTFHVQAILFDAAALPLGTSHALQIDFQ